MQTAMRKAFTRVPGPASHRHCLATERATEVSMFMASPR